MVDALQGVITSNLSRVDETIPAADDISDEHRYRQRCVPIISYTIRQQAALMNSWEDPYYFTSSRLRRATSRVTSLRCVDDRATLPQGLSRASSSKRHSLLQRNNSRSLDLQKA